MKRIKDENTDSRVYKMTMRRKIIKCTLCPPHKGCNRFGSDQKNGWKDNRKKQYREK